MFYLSLVLLLVEVNPILEEQGRKKNALVAYDISCVKMILTLLTKIVVLHI